MGSALRLLLALGIMLLMVGRFFSGISHNGLGRGSRLFRMETDLVGLWVVVVVMVGLAVLTTSVILTIILAILLVLVVSGVFCMRPTIARIILRIGTRLGFPPVVVFIFQGCLGCVGVLVRERNLRGLSRGE